VYEPCVLLKGPFALDGFDLVQDGPAWRPDGGYEALVGPIWQERAAVAAARGHPIWDGTHYRLTHADDLTNGGPVRLGTIDFRYIVTIRRLWDAHVARGHGPYHHISTAALLRTADGHYVFGKRAVNGTVDLIGGAFQPDETLGEAANFETNVLKEIREETGIGRGALGAMTGLGIVMSTTSNVLVVADVPTMLTRDAVLETFATREDDEMAEPVFVPAAGVRDYLRGLGDYRAVVAGLA
jgi:8-oxo-dGTP pyrophosphatase MutT (NUDIX family)